MPSLPSNPGARGVLWWHQHQWLCIKLECPLQAFFGDIRKGWVGDVYQLREMLSPTSFSR